MAVNVFRIVARTAFYPVFVLAVLFCAYFIYQPCYCGMKLFVLHKSYSHHFHRVYFDDAYPALRAIAQLQAGMLNRGKEDFRIVDDAFLAEEFYYYKYTYTIKGVDHIGIESFRMKWKPWEYYYDEELILTDKDSTSEFSKAHSYKAVRLWIERNQLISDKKDKLATNG